MMEVRSVSAEEVRPLRHALLRPGAKMELSVYPGDDEPSSLHLELYDGETLVSVATVIDERRSGTADANACQLRGMAGLKRIAIAARE